MCRVSWRDYGTNDSSRCWLREMVGLRGFTKLHGMAVGFGSLRSWWDSNFFLLFLARLTRRIRVIFYVYKSFLEEGKEGSFVSYRERVVGTAINLAVS